MTLLSLLNTAAETAEYADHLARSVRGDSYVPVTAEELPALKAELAEVELAADAAMDAYYAAIRKEAAAQVAAEADLSDDEDPYECDGDFEAEVAGEAARYGDSGPGTGLQVRIIRDLRAARDQERRR